MSTQGDWLKDLADAAAELGYVVDRIDERRVSLRRFRGDIEIEISGYLVGGPLLRELLKPEPPKA